MGDSHLRQKLVFWAEYPTPWSIDERQKCGMLVLHNEVDCSLGEVNESHLKVLMTADERLRPPVFWWEHYK